MIPTLDDLTPYGLQKFEAWYARRPGRESDGKKHQDRESVGYGWCGALIDGGRWFYFTAETRERLEANATGRRPGMGEADES